MSYNKLSLLILTLLALACGGGGVGSDLSPSGSDQRESVESGSTGPQVGQMAPDFSQPDTMGNTITLQTELAKGEATVLYFTMWCPVCDVHSSHLRSKVLPSYEDTNVHLVDFVSGDVALSRSSQNSSGYGNMSTIVDASGELQDDYEANMGSVVLISRGGEILLNEYYKDGSRLIELLNDIENGFID